MPKRILVQQNLYNKNFAFKIAKNILCYCSCRSSEKLPNNILAESLVGLNMKVRVSISVARQICREVIP